MSNTIASGPLPAIEFAQRTDPGRDPTKQQNEDAAGHRETRFGHLCVVCDGMGGHSGGQEASNAALAAIFETFDDAKDDASPRDLLRDAILRANVRVRSLGTDDTPDGRPGSTVVAILLHVRGTEVAHAGDSRAFLIHEGQIFQITRDHSMVQQMVDAHLLTPAQAAVHPDANKITRALGIEDDIEVDIRSAPIAHVAGDVFVLCTDGLSDLVESPEILQVASAEPPAQAAWKLVDLANARGGHDNITVQVLRVRESAIGPAHGVADTIVETRPERLPVKTVVLSAAPPKPGRTTEPPPAPFIPDAPRTSSPSSSGGARGKPQISTVAGLLLAAAGIVIAIVVLYMHAEARKGRSRQVNPSLSGPLPTSVPSSVVSLTPQPLEPLPNQPLNGDSPPSTDGTSNDAGPAGLAPLRPPSVRHSHRP